MNIYGIIIIVVAFLIGVFYSKRGAQQDAKVLDLTAKIKEKQDEAAAKQADADQKVKDYQDALKKYDPGFDDDNGSGKPTA